MIFCEYVVNVKSRTTTIMKRRTVSILLITFCVVINLQSSLSTSFNSSSNWNAYDASNINGLNTIGYAGIAFDGRFLYFTPYYDGTNYYGIVLRYDTNSPFNSTSSWNAYDASHTNGLNTVGYYGVVFDGRFVYFSPYQNATNSFHGIVLRYDTGIIPTPQLTPFPTPFPVSTTFVSTNSSIIPISIIIGIVVTIIVILIVIIIIVVVLFLKSKKKRKQQNQRKNEAKPTSSTKTIFENENDFNLENVKSEYENISKVKEKNENEAQIYNKLVQQN